MANQQPVISEAEVVEWVREHYQAAAKYLAEEGYIVDVVHLQDSRYLAPHVAVWRFTSMDKQAVWIINGDVPTAMVAANVANDARAVMRHFALQWQLQAEAVLQGSSLNEESKSHAEYLIKRAELVYQATQHDELWASAG